MASDTTTQQATSPQAESYRALARTLRNAAATGYRHARHAEVLGGTEIAAALRGCARTQARAARKWESLATQEAQR